MGLSDRLDKLFCEEEDDLVGSVIGDVELTEKGIHWRKNGWWYFPHELKYPDGEQKGVYWYKKKRLDEEGGKVVELYVGSDVSDVPFDIPSEFKVYLMRLVADMESGE